MKEGYSFKKGIAKSAVSLLSVLGALVMFANLGDVSIWDLIVKYVEPLVASLTVGGVITLLVNYIKFNYLS